MANKDKLNFTKESYKWTMDKKDSFEHKSSGYNSFDNGSSTEDIRSTCNEEIDSKGIQSVVDSEEHASKASCDTSNLAYDALSKIVSDKDNGELKEDNTFNTMCQESNNDDQNKNGEMSDRTECNSGPINEVLEKSDNTNKQVNVSCVLHESINTVASTDGPIVVQNGCDDVDASRLKRQIAFDEDTNENTKRTFEPDSSECSMVTKDNNANDEYRLEETKIDKLSCEPSRHPNLCSPVSVDGQFTNADSFDRTSRESDSHSNSRDSSRDRTSIRSDTSSSSDSSVDGASRVGATSGRADSRDSTFNFGSAFSLVSNNSEYEVKKREPRIVRINGGRTDFIQIETVKYKYKKKKHIQHYIKRLKNSEVDGYIVLRPKDLLLEVEGRSVKNITQKKILKLFKKIKPNREGKICLGMTFRRWEGGKEGTEEFEVDYRLQLTLEPENDDVRVLEEQSTRSAESRHIKTLTEKLHHGQKQLKRHKSFRVSNRQKTEIKKTQVPRGQINNVEDKGVVTGRLRVVHSGPDEYITAGDDGKVLIQVPTKINEGDNLFKLHQMEAIDMAPETYPVAFLTRISPRGREPNTFLMSDIKNGDGLKFEVSMVTVSNVQESGDVDESFFKKREYADQIMFESLLYRGNYISCRPGDINTPPTLQMVQKSNDDVKNDRNVDSCKFEYFKANSDKFGGSERSENLLSRLVGIFFGCVSCRSSRHQAYTNSLRRPSSINQHNQEGAG